MTVSTLDTALCNGFSLLSLRASAHTGAAIRIPREKEMFL